MLVLKYEKETFFNNVVYKERFVKKVGAISGITVGILMLCVFVFYILISNGFGLIPREGREQAPQVYPEVSAGEEKINVLFGTDWYQDCDDVVAARILATFHKSERIELLAVGINAYSPVSVPSLDAFLTGEGLPDIPIGIDLNSDNRLNKPKWQPRLAQLPGEWRENLDVPSAVRVYRQALANASGKVDMLEVGFLNVVQELMNSQPDDISPLSGMELIELKVNRLWCMGGKWLGFPLGREYNLSKSRQARYAAHAVCADFPVPITFLGQEVGNSVKSGANLNKSDPLRKVLDDYGAKAGRSSWDPMTALLCCIGDETVAGYTVVYGRASVDKLTGINSFKKSTEPKTEADLQLYPHRYVIKKYPDSYYCDWLDEILEK